MPAFGFIVFAPDGIEGFDDAWSRGVEIDGIPACSLHYIIERKRSANRPRDRASLPRLEAFRQYLREAGVRHRLLQTPRNQSRRHGCAARPEATNADRRRRNSRAKDASRARFLHNRLRTRPEANPSLECAAPHRHGRVGLPALLLGVHTLP